MMAILFIFLSFSFLLPPYFSYSLPLLLATPSSSFCSPLPLPTHPYSFLLSPTPPSFLLLPTRPYSFSFLPTPLPLSIFT